MPKFSRFRPRAKSQKKKGVKAMVKSVLRRHDQAMLQVKQIAPVTVSSNTLTGVDHVIAATSILTQGSGDDQRIGDQIRPLYLEVNSMFFTLSSMTAGQNILIRCVWVRDSMCDGNDATGQDLFEHTSDPLSVYNQVHQLNRPKRFQILSDKLINLVTGTDRSSKAVRQRINLRKAGPIKYLSNSGTVTSCGKGSIFCILLSNTSNNGVSYNIDYRLGFTDA